MSNVLITRKPQKDVIARSILEHIADQFNPESTKARVPLSGMDIEIDVAPRIYGEDLVLTCTGRRFHIVIREEIPA